MGWPTLSVILPNYNHACYIGGALEAILSQSVRPAEVIVVDDTSTDNSVEVIEGFCRRDPVVRLIRNTRNLGNVGSTAVALRECEGDYIFNAAADDVVLPGFFEKSLNLLVRHPEAGLCCGWPSTMDGATGEISENAVNWSDRPCYLTPDELAERIDKHIIPGHASIVRRAAFEQVGGYHEALRWHSDWYSSLAIGFRHGICFLPEPVALMRVLPGSFSAAGRTDRTAQLTVLRALWQILFSADCRDLLPRFQRANALAHFGVEAAIAAADLGWEHEPDVHALLGGLTWRECAELLGHPRPEVRCVGAGASAHLGRHAGKVLLRLSALLDDENGDVRTAVERTFDFLEVRAPSWETPIVRLLRHRSIRRAAAAMRIEAVQNSADSVWRGCRKLTKMLAGAGIRRRHDPAHASTATTSLPHGADHPRAATILRKNVLTFVTHSDRHRTKSGSG
jgi:hypothetical protein